MRVLVDSSVWIEFFRKKSQLSEKLIHSFAQLVQEEQVVTIHPIPVEVLSGFLSSSKEKPIREAFDVLPTIDLDWNLKETWDRIIHLAQIAHRSSLSIPGIVDRMILLAALESDVILWTLDRSLQRLAGIQKVKLYSGD